jgi:hypothetical protein
MEALFYQTQDLNLPAIAQALVRMNTGRRDMRRSNLAT